MGDDAAKQPVEPESSRAKQAAKPEPLSKSLVDDKLKAVENLDKKVQDL